MLAKKVTALLVSAALVLALLAGCGNGSKALSQVMADLLSGLYTNVDVEVDSDLTAALKKAAAEGGTEEEILTRLVNNLNLSGVSISFNRLDDGQQGEHRVDLAFQAGSDPDAAARNALAQWAGIFGSLPDDGSYRASVAMIEADNGYYIAVDVEVLKAGTPDKEDSDDEDDPGYNIEENTYMVYSSKGLTAWADAVLSGNYSLDCTLTNDIDLDGVTWEPIGDASNEYTGHFDGGGHTISNLDIVFNEEEWKLSYYGLFGYVGESGTIENISVSGNIDTKLGGYVGMIAGLNKGNILNCDVSGTITGKGNTGGVAGFNYGKIEGCTVTADVMYKDPYGVEMYSYVGGVVGCNGFSRSYEAEVIGCAFTGNVTGKYYVGGVAGCNYAAISACYAKGSAQGEAYVGGLVGTNPGTQKKVEGCYFTGSVNGSTKQHVGGAFGKNEQAQYVVECYWNGTSSSGLGVGKGDEISNGTARKVPDETTWNDAMAAMNNAISSTGYQFDGTADNPVLNK